MKYPFSSIKNKLISRYTKGGEDTNKIKSTDINVLLNRVKLDKEKESRQKILFSVVTSLGVVLFGVLIF